MLKKLHQLSFLSVFIFTYTQNIKAQCPEAEAYVQKVQAADSWTPTERASSGKKIQAWTQLGSWHAYRCECENGGNLSDNDLSGLVEHLNLIKSQIASNYSAYGSVPSTSISDCKKKGAASASSSGARKSSTQQKLMQSFANYNKAMNFKKQGETIAKAFAKEVEYYSQLNKAKTPEDLLEKFNNNMNAIAELQAQNKADNLNQIGNTIESSLRDLNSGNHEGALFSALSLIDQGEARRNAKRKAELYKAQLKREAKEQMDAFYKKALELNQEQISSFYNLSAYAINKNEETNYLSNAEYLECYAIDMKSNYTFNSTSWLTNYCDKPIVSEVIDNPYKTKLDKYQNAAERKMNLYHKYNNPIFKKGALRIAGAIANEKPSAASYYQLGHYAGTEQPLVAFLAFTTSKELNTSFWDATKNQEFFEVEKSLENYAQEVIEENEIEILKEFIRSGIHTKIQIKGYSLLEYTLLMDKPEIAQVFLDETTKLLKHDQKLNKVKEFMALATIFDAEKTLERYVNFGFDPFTISWNNKNLIQLSVDENSLNVFTYLLKKSEKKENIIQEYQNSEIILAYKTKQLDESQEIIKNFNLIQSVKLKNNLTLHYYYLENSHLVKSLGENDPKSIPDLIIESYLSENDITTLVDLIEIDPLFISKIPFNKKLTDEIYDEQQWRFATKENTTNAYKEYLINPRTKKYRTEILQNLIDIKEVPVLIRARNKQDKYGCIDRKGNIVIPFKYDLMLEFKNGLAAVKKGKFMGFINKKGEVVIPIKYQGAFSFENNLALVLENDKAYSINRKGEKIAEIGEYLNTTYWGTDLLSTTKNGEHILTNRKGEKIAGEEFEYFVYDPTKIMKPFSKDFVLVQSSENNKFGIINHSGKIIIPPVYAQILPNFSQGLFFAQKKVDGKWGVIDSENNELTPFIYDSANYIRWGNLFSPHKEAYVNIGNDKVIIKSDGTQIEYATDWEVKDYDVNDSYGTEYSVPFPYLGDHNLIKGYFNHIKKITKLQCEASVKTKMNWQIKSVKFGINDEDGRTIIKPSMILINGFSFDYIEMELDGKPFLVNVEGDLVEKSEI
ncbi:WG repeat-containing protein [Mangrovimonas sp. TPBH4]|uniref:WG repeat-containing protein n=1 Tax=Mangrovimonas sp. TPBH4 TaxID=1645914 RepID=UPI0006B59735|nr:WG repeat-containing protein [Mangrovimonas sp. TPBH4]